MAAGTGGHDCGPADTKIKQGEVQQLTGNDRDQGQGEVVASDRQWRQPGHTACSLCSGQTEGTMSLQRHERRVA